MPYSFQTMTLLRGPGHIQNTLDNRREEEYQVISVGGKVRIEELAILLGGEGRKPRLAGTGWKHVPPEELPDPLDSARIAELMVANAREGTEVNGITSVLAVEKPISIYAALDADFRADLMRIMDEAGDRYISFCEKNVRLRLGEGGSRPEGVKGLMTWRVLHAMSSAGDPHIHDHFLFSTTAVGARTRRSGQIDTDHFTREVARKAQAVAQHYIRSELKKKGWKFTPDGSVVGFDRDLIERASTAHTSIKEIKNLVSLELGIPISEDQAWHHWRQIASGRGDVTAGQDLVDKIVAERNSVQVDPAVLKILDSLQKMLATGKESSEVLEHQLDDLLSKPETAQIVAQWLCDRYGIDDPEAFLASIREQWVGVENPEDIDEVIAIIKSCGRAPGLYSVQALCIRSAGEEGASELFERVMLDPRIVVAINRFGRPNFSTLKEFALSEEQVEKLADQLIKETTDDLQTQLQDLSTPLTLIGGVAGGGKSTALLRANTAWEGRTVWSAARNRKNAVDSGEASNADEEKIVSFTALKMQVDKGKGPAPGDVLVVDEWAVADNVYVDLILKLACNGVIVKGLGDQYQTQPIDCGTHARIVMEVAKKKGGAILEESKRCAAWIDLHDQLRDIVTTRHPGKESIDALIENLDVRVAFTPADVADILDAAGPDAVAVTASNKDRLAIVEQLLTEPEPKNISEIITLDDGGAIWAGLEVRVKENIWDENVRLVAMNGQQGKTISVDATHVTIELEGERLTLDRAIAKKHLRLGGRAQTGAGAQGQTLGQGVPVLNGGENSTWVYSTATRSKKTPIVVVMCEKNDDPRVVWKEAQKKLRAVLSRDGINRTVKELKEDALKDTIKPRSPDEMVPWLRQYWGKWDVLQRGIEDGTISLERPETVAQEPEIVDTEIEIVHEAPEPEILETPEPVEPRPHPLDIIQESQQVIAQIREPRGKPMDSIAIAVKVVAQPEAEPETEVAAQSEPDPALTIPPISKPQFPAQDGIDGIS